MAFEREFPIIYPDDLEKLCNRCWQNGETTHKILVPSPDLDNLTVIINSCGYKVVGYEEGSTSKFRLCKDLSIIDRHFYVYDYKKKMEERGQGKCVYFINADDKEALKTLFADKGIAIIGVVTPEMSGMEKTRFCAVPCP